MMVKGIHVAAAVLIGFLCIHQLAASRERCRGSGRECRRGWWHSSTSLPPTDTRGGSSAASDWGYEEHNGPSTWPTTFPTCAGNSQSPVNIITKDVKRDTNEGDLKFNSAYSIHRFGDKLLNDGHTAKVELNNLQGSPQVTYKGEVYTAVQAHFHWGSSDDKGSEHQVDGKQYSCEFHIVHYKASYGSFEEASKHPDGLLVIGVFYEASSFENLDLLPITAALPFIRNNGTETVIGYLTLRHLIPKQNCFYSYQGSLTTPTCDEVVQWIVYSKPLKIHHNQLEAFRQLLVGNKPLVDNFRPPQPLNNRIIHYSC